MTTPPALPTIAVVDDEPAMLKALVRLLREADFNPIPFASGNQLLQHLDDHDIDGALLDLHMPGCDGMELQALLAERRPDLAVVFLTGRGDIASSVQAMRNGAVNFLTKPVNDHALITALLEAVECSRAQRKSSSDHEAAAQKLASLTTREHEILTHVLAGKPNKCIAADLDISEQTVKVHRMRIHQKMGLSSIAELTRTADMLGVRPA